MFAAFMCALAVAACGGDSKPAAAPTPAPTEAAAETSTAPQKVDRFDAKHAWSMLKYQVDLGPRPAGSKTSKKLAAYIKRRLPHGRYEKVPGGLTNVVGEIPGKGKATVVAAH